MRCEPGVIAPDGAIPGSSKIYAREKSDVIQD